MGRAARAEPSKSHNFYILCTLYELTQYGAHEPACSQTSEFWRQRDITGFTTVDAATMDAHGHLAAPRTLV